MRKLVLAIATLLVGAAPALAADMAYRAAPVALPNNWNGWYAGVNVGAAINDSVYDLNPSGCFLTGCGAGGIPGNAFRQFSTGVSGTDFTGGGQVGYNYHFAPLWVAGLETDFNYNGLRNTDSITQGLGAPLFAPSSFVHSVSASLDWFGTFRGRIGFLATPNVLLYGTGGLAYGEVKSTTSVTFPPPGLSDTYVGSASKTRAGFAAGAGAEWLMYAGWSLKAEYLYVDLGHTDYSNACVSPAAVCGATVPPVYQTSVSTREHIARVGINYHFPQW